MIFIAFWVIITVIVQGAAFKKISDDYQGCNVSISDALQKHKERIIFYGPMGRHNFGDIFFPQVFVKNLRHLCNISGYDVHYADILPRNMTKYGFRDVAGITSFMKDSVKTHVVLMGGNIFNCGFQSALWMFNPELPVPEFETCEWKRWVSEFSIAYMLKKSLFHNPGSFVANTIGLTKMNPEVEAILAGYEYVSTRTPPGKPQKIFAPDSVITIKKNFGYEILSRRHLAFKYIAVQFRADLERIDMIAKQLVKIVKATHFGVVFFRAGACRGTDRLDQYNMVVTKMADQGVKDNIHIFGNLNIWAISSLIANAELTIGTSLHVRIVSFAFSVPRVTFSPRDKHLEMIDNWDFGAIACNITGIGRNQIFHTAIATLKCTEFKNQEHSQKAVRMYMDMFSNMIQAMRICDLPSSQ